MRTAKYKQKVTREKPTTAMRIRRCKFPKCTVKLNSYNLNETCHLHAFRWMEWKDKEILKLLHRKNKCTAMIQKGKQEYRDKRKVICRRITELRGCAV